MCGYSDFSLIFKRFTHANTSVEKQRIVDHFVEKLCNDELTDEEIIIIAHRLTDEEIKIAQGNGEMIKNNYIFNELIKETLDKKNRLKKNLRKHRKIFRRRNEP